MTERLTHFLFFIQPWISISVKLTNFVLPYWLSFIPFYTWNQLISFCNTQTHNCWDSVESVDNFKILILLLILLHFLGLYIIFVLKNLIFLLPEITVFQEWLLNIFQCLFRVSLRVAQMVTTPVMIIRFLYFVSHI